MNAAHETQVVKDKLIKDFYTVIADAEELLKATANQTGERVGAARERVEESLRETKERLSELQDDVLARSKAAARRTDEYVHDNPWQSIGVSAALGFLLGMLISRR
ncbi:MAG: YqjD family protein [Desulfosudis oleivorans]|nr:YqjD family protein [Desulfosudis oleivorans]